MAKLAFAGALSCALVLAGCSSTGTVIGSTIGSAAGGAIGAQVSPSTITKAQSYAKVACAILPAAESLRELYAASNGALATASSLADVACRALTAGAAYTADMPPLPPRRPRKGAPVQGAAVVNGKPVPITGTIAK
jgi:hypothetical protein